MSLETQFLAALEALNETNGDLKNLKSLAISSMDLTLLDETATPLALQTLSEKANLNQVAAICVLAQHIKSVSPTNTVKLATVVNFPSGLEPLAKVIAEVDSLLAESSIDEIDYVFPYQTYLAGDEQSALTHCQQIYSLCKQSNITFKVILETGYFTDVDTLYELSRKIIDNGCDFLKTSTGKISQGATPLAAFTILKAIEASNSNCGIKVSGGIKQPAQAFTYLGLALQSFKDINKSRFRIGASSLLDELLAN